MNIVDGIDIILVKRGPVDYKQTEYPKRKPKRYWALVWNPTKFRRHFQDLTKR